MALSADGRLLASASFDGTVRLWEANAGRPLATLQGHAGPVYGVALSAAGQLLASGGEDGTIRLWEVSTGASLRIVRSDRRYERTDITGLTGVTAAQRAALLALGAIDRQAPGARPQPDCETEKVLRRGRASDNLVKVAGAAVGVKQVYLRKLPATIDRVAK